MNRVSGWVAGAMLSVVAATAIAAQSGSPYQPVAFLAGHCWKGSSPDGKRTDEHCFKWIYGDKFLRDEHVVHAGEGAPHAGESIYYWNGAAQQLEYLYVESDGGFSQGPVTVQGDALVFPATSFVENGKTMIYRSRWVRAADNAYDVVTEFQDKDAWVPGFKFHMQRTD